MRNAIVLMVVVLIASSFSAVAQVTNDFQSPPNSNSIPPTQKPIEIRTTPNPRNVARPTDPKYMTDYVDKKITTLEKKIAALELRIKALEARQIK
jgi:hypothetical protein